MGKAVYWKCEYIQLKEILMLYYSEDFYTDRRYKCISVSSKKNEV